MLAIGENPFFGRLVLETQPTKKTKTTGWPLLLKQKPTYLSRIEPHEDDQAAIFHSYFAQIHFPELKKNSFHPNLQLE
jgi:hypothetical protein